MFHKRVTLNNLNNFETKIRLICTCDINNINNDMLQEVKPTDNKEIDRVLVKNHGDLLLYRVNQTLT